MKLLLILIFTAFSVVASSQLKLSSDPILDKKFLFEFSDDSLNYELIFEVTDETDIERYKAHYILYEEIIRSGFTTYVEKDLNCWRSSEILFTDSLGNTYFPMSCNNMKGETYFGLDFFENDNDFISVLYTEMRQVDAKMLKDIKLKRKRVNDAQH